MERHGQAAFAEIDLQGVFAFAQEGPPRAPKLNRATKDFERARAWCHLHPERPQVADVPQRTPQEAGMSPGVQCLCALVTDSVHWGAYLGFLALLGDRLYQVAE